MSIDSIETSVSAADPVELYQFSIGATVYRYTSADVAQIFNSQTWTPAPITRASEDFTQEARSGNLELKLPDSDPVSQIFIAGVPAQPVFIQRYRGFRSLVSTSWIGPFDGRVLSATFQSGVCTLSCVPVSGLLQRLMPRLGYQAQCNWTLYGAGCGVDKTAFRVTAALATVSGAVLTSSTFASKPDQWFRNGWVENGAGVRQMVIDHVTSQITLLRPIVGLHGGDTVYAFAGCDRDENTCFVKFNNRARHLGFKRIPQVNPFTGSLV